MKYINIGLVILFILLIAYPFLILPRTVKITKFECYSQYGICSDEIFAKLNPILDKTLIDAKASVINSFKEDNLVEDHSFQFKLPGTLRINIILRKAKFAIGKFGLNEAALIDKSGNVLTKNKVTGLSILFMPEDLPEIGKKVSQEKLFALEVLNSVYYMYQVNTGEIKNNSLIITIPNGPKVIFPLEGEKDVLLGSLRLVLSKINQGIIEIDLRFKNPIIR